MTGLLYVQGDGTLLVQSDNPDYDAARADLMAFSDLVQRLDPIHVYQVRPISLWQAASTGKTARQVLAFLRQYAAHPIPYALQQLIAGEMSKWGRLALHQGARGRIVLRGCNADLDAARAVPAVRELALSDDGDGLVFLAGCRAEVKQILASAGWPVRDNVGYQDAPAISFSWDGRTQLRDYQWAAVEQFYANTRDQSGVVVLPCGAGKTIVGIAIIQALGRHALVLTPSDTSAKQWQKELLERTTLTDDDVALYHANRPLAPITITTYQKVAAKKRSGEREHLRRLTGHPWGIVVYDEVHMLPAPLFRLAADLQGARRLGLTATLVREDGAEADVFSLIGSKVFEVPWKQLEQAGYLAAVRCVEVHVPLSAADAALYERASVRERHKIAALNPAKVSVVRALLAKHPGESAMVIGHYLESLQTLAASCTAPWSAARRRSQNASSGWNNSGPGRFARLSCPALPTWQWISRAHRLPSRCQGCSDRVRKKRSDWAGCCDHTPKKVCFTRWSARTPLRRKLQNTDSCISWSRGMPTTSWTPRKY